MTLEEILRICGEADAEEWHVVETAEPGYFRNRLETWTSGDDWGLFVTTPSQQAVYKDNVSLALSWGMPFRLEESGLPDRNRYQGEWVNRFSDEEAELDVVDVLWCGTVVSRHLRVIVDGGRVALPMPKIQRVEDGDDRWHVTEWERRFAWLIHDLGGTEAYSYSDYFERSGIEVRG